MSFVPINTPDSAPGYFPADALGQTLAEQLGRQKGEHHGLKRGRQEGESVGYGRGHLAGWNECAADANQKIQRLVQQHTQEKAALSWQVQELQQRIAEMQGTGTELHAAATRVAEESTRIGKESRSVKQDLAAERDRCQQLSQESTRKTLEFNRIVILLRSLVPMLESIADDRSPQAQRACEQVASSYGDAIRLGLEQRVIRGAPHQDGEFAKEYPRTYKVICAILARCRPQSFQTTRVQTPIRKVG